MQFLAGLGEKGLKIMNSYFFVYSIGIAEKGFMNVELTVESSVGHASMPPRESSIGILANAISKYVILSANRGERGGQGGLTTPTENFVGKF